jgi:hypothetical protein
VPFDVAKAAREYQERRATWSPAAAEAYERESHELYRWVLSSHKRRVRQAFQAMRRTTILASSGVPLPEEEEPQEHRLSAPNHLYVLAQEARSGGSYSDYARFLRNLNVEADGDTIVAAVERLRITFEPKGNNTRVWWLEPSEKAGEWLRDQLVKDGVLQDVGALEWNPLAINPKDKNKDPRRMWDPALSEFALCEAIYAELPEQQANVIWLYTQFHDEDRPRETTKAIAEFLNITPDTVRWHKAEAIKNPGFRRLFGLP